jgi:hypothetical protein
MDLESLVDSAIDPMSHPWWCESEAVGG